jgi:hypothetical protein
MCCLAAAAEPGIIALQKQYPVFQLTAVTRLAAVNVLLPVSWMVFRSLTSFLPCTHILRACNL